MRRAPHVCVLLVAALEACHRGSTDQTAEIPASCVVEHDGGVTQCFDEIGRKAKVEGPKYCQQMHGTHAYRVGIPCPTGGVVGSCRKGSGTETERIEHCYREGVDGGLSCEARCAKSGGIYSQ